MKIIISENIINEALKASEFRPLMQVGRELAMERINQIWPRLEAQADSKNRSADRLYFNLEKSEEEELQIPSKDKIISYLNQANYEVVDFKEGLVRKKGDKNIVRLGKVLTMLSKSDPKAKNLLNVYNNEKSVMVLDETDDYVMVISRHPYDIGGMSTDRVWRSCMNLRGGEERQYVPIDIEKGTIVSYLLNKNDLNIKNPIARISIKPFISKSNEKDVLYGIEQDSVKYGRQHEGYVKKLINVLDIAQEEKTGIFKRDEDLYSDNEEKEIVLNFSKKDVEKFKSSVKEFVGDLTVEKIKKEYFWLLLADIQDAVIGESGGDLVWYSGTWKGGTWELGKWQNGVWENGLWKTGTWKSGKWKSGVWKNGAWEDGLWENGTWEYGAWEGGLWENGTWKDGLWKNGTWKDGTWERGKWGSGSWKGGLWKGGIWSNGTWERGIWKKGWWENGEWNGGKWGVGNWKSGVWNGGVWVDGIWGSGIWNGGIWKDGTWEGGTWRGGWWDEGTWEGGTWGGGTWKIGDWKGGVWDGGTWKDGQWGGGTWKDGQWNSGAWEHGIWKNGIWVDGIWNGGKWEVGVWKSGVWNTGVWKGGEWDNGTWKNGMWKDGVWKSGVWVGGWWDSGTWRGGTWKGGTWKGGNIWNGSKYVESPQPPK